MTVHNTVWNSTPHAGREMFFWHFLKNYWSKSHQSKFSWCLGRLSGECIDDKHHRIERLQERLLKSSTWKKALFLHFLFVSSELYIFPGVLKIIKRNRRQVQGEERDRSTKNSKLKIQFTFEVNEVNVWKTSRVIQELAFCPSPIEIKMRIHKPDMKQ